MNKNIVLSLVVALAITVMVFIFVSEKQKKKGAQLIAPAPNPLIPAPIPTGQPALATNPIYGQYPTYPATQPIQIPVPQANNVGFPIGIGSTGIIVKMVQAALGLKVDGKYGLKTDAVVKAKGIDLSTSQAFTDKFVSITDPVLFAQCFPLKMGSKNNYVKGVQIMLNLTPDGVFGANTEAAALKATGKTVLHHIDYTTLLAAHTNVKVKYNSKPLNAETVKNITKGLLSGISLPGFSLINPFI